VAKLSEPLVSVIVPLYNYQQYIGDCIRSIENQTYKNWELIIVDDCSTDKSFKVAKKFACDKIRVVKTTKNKGYSKAKNEAIKLSNGKYITALDADDMFTRESLALRVSALIKHKVLFVHARAISFVGNLTLEQCYKSTKFSPPARTRIHAQTVMVDRKIYQKYGLYDESLRSRADKEMWWRLFGPWGNNAKGLPKFVRPALCCKSLGANVAYYRLHKKSMTNMRAKNKKYNQKVTKLLREAYVRRCKKINKKNTRFL